MNKYAFLYFKAAKETAISLVPKHLVGTLAERMGPTLPEVGKMPVGQAIKALAPPVAQGLKAVAPHAFPALAAGAGATSGALDAGRASEYLGLKGWGKKLYQGAGALAGGLTGIAPMLAAYAPAAVSGPVGWAGLGASALSSLGPPAYAKYLQNAETRRHQGNMDWLHYGRLGKTPPPR